jgi:hypothetical protein
MLFWKNDFSPVHEKEAWWRVVMNFKFGNSWGGWCSNEPLGSYGVGVWKNIRRGWGMFSSNTKLELGEGTKVKFWHDLWCEDKALKKAFPDLRCEDKAPRSNSSIVRLFVPYEMLFFSQFGLSWVMPNRVADLFACWWISCSTRCVEDGAFLSIAVSLEDRERTLAKLESFFFFILYISILMIFRLLIKKSFNDIIFKINGQLCNSIF